VLVGAQEEKSKTKNEVGLKGRPGKPPAYMCAVVLLA